MKVCKRILSVALAVLLILALGACGRGPTGNGGKEQLKMATAANFPPYEYYEQGNIVGIDAEVAAAVADKLDMELVIEDMEFGSIVGAVQQGKVDMGMAGMTVTPDREENVNFSISYATGVQVIIVAENSSIATFDDLEGKTIGVQENTTGDIYVTDDFGDDAVQRYNKGTDAVQALVQGKVDAVVIDNEPAKVFVQESPGLKILDTEYIIEQYAIAIGKGKTELLEKINQALEELIADGTLEEIVDRYITAD